MRIETGGFAIVLHIDFVKTSNTTCTYRIFGKIEVTSAGEYEYDRIGVLSNTSKINSIGIKCINPSDVFNCGKAIIKKY